MLIGVMLGRSRGESSGRGKRPSGLVARRPSEDSQTAGQGAARQADDVRCQMCDVRCQKWGHRDSGRKQPPGVGGRAFREARILFAHCFPSKS